MEQKAKTKINMNDIKAKTKQELESIVWSLWVDYAVPDNTDEGQTHTFNIKFNKIKREKPHFTDIDYQKCTYSNGKLYI